MSEAQILSAIANFEEKVDKGMAQLDEKVERQNREISQQLHELSRRITMMENSEYGKMALMGSGFGGPAPVRYVPTGSGLVDPAWRWDREHPYRSR